MVRQHYSRHVWLTLWLFGVATPLATGVEVANIAMDRALTTQPGDARRGALIATDTRKGNCGICHALPIGTISADAFGNLGPPLAGVGSRLRVPQLRQRIVDPRVISAQTVMPAYFSTDGLTRVDPAYAGKTILSAQDVEDLVAFLASLK